MSTLSHTNTPRKSDFFADTSTPQTDRLIGRPVANAGETKGEAVVQLRVPEFDRVSIAVASRSAGRLNARSIPDDQYTYLMNQRRRLIEKKYSSGISRDEERELAYVNWSIDRIEDARYGEELDKLERAAESYENLSHMIVDLQSSLVESVRHKRK